MSRIDENPFRTKVRSRFIPTGFKPTATSVYYSSTSGRTPVGEAKELPELCDAQITVSEGHPFWADFKDQDGIKPDLGGDFSTTRWSTILDKRTYSASYVDGIGRLWQGSGPIIPNSKDSYGNVTNRGWGYISRNTDIGGLANTFSARNFTDDQLLARGTTAIARTRPDVSPASITQFLVELKRDGIPFASKLSREELQRLLREFQKEGVSIKSVKRSADYFLEDQFGLMPFYKDLSDFVQMASNGNSTLDFLMQNSGKLIRRRYSFPDENDSTTVGLPTNLPFSFTRNASDVGRSGNYFTSGDDPAYHPFRVKTERRSWFSGAYRIWMPKDMEPVSRLRSVVDHLRWDYGLDLDFATMWNLAPWSWLIDWHLNLGDVITNVSKWSSDAVVLHYGYVMSQSTTEYITQANTQWTNGVTVHPDRNVPSFGIRVVNKRRLRATPYGFGKAYASLTVKQKAILAAIGITRF